MAHKLTLISDLSKAQALHEAGLLWEELIDGRRSAVSAPPGDAWVVPPNYTFVSPLDSDRVARLNGTHKNFRIGLLLEE